MPSSPVILHLTDLHFGAEKSALGADQRTLALRSLVRALGAVEPAWKPTILCITGDIGYRGAPSDYEQAAEWIAELCKRLDLTTDDLFLCAGNHDLSRERAACKIPARSRNADQLLSFPLDEKITQPFANFDRFARDLGVPPYRLGNETSHLVGVRDHAQFRIISCNSSWFSYKDNDRGRLWLGLPLLLHLEASRQIGDVSNVAGPPFVVALLHHPDDYLAAEELSSWSGRLNTRDYLSLRAHVLLSGHTHAEVRAPDRIANGGLRFTSGATYAAASYANVATLLRFEGTCVRRLALRYEPSSAMHDWERWPHTEAFALSIAGESALPRELLVRRRVELRTKCLRYLEEKWRALADVAPPNDLPRLRWRAVARARAGSADHDDTQQSLPLLDGVLASRGTLLLGDMGTGKSTAVAQLARDWIDASDDALAVVLSANRCGQLANFEAVAEALLSSLYEPELAATLTSGGPNSGIMRALVVVDGLDEVPGSIAEQLLGYFERLLQTHGDLYIVVSGRLLEPTPATSPTWAILEPLPPTDGEATQILAADLASRGSADGRDPMAVAQQFLRKFRALPQAGSLASTPLGLRLLLRALPVEARASTFSAAEVLSSVLLERLGAWDQRSRRPGSGEFEKMLPTPEQRLKLYARIVHELFDSPPDLLRVEGAFERAMPNATPALRLDARVFFEARRLLRTSGESLFPLWPFAELAAGLGAALLLQDGKRTWSTEENSRWRVFSYGLYYLSRLGSVELAEKAGTEYLGHHLTSRNEVAAMAFVVAESGSAVIARAYLGHLARLGPRPLAGFPFDFLAPAWAIARSLALAADEGFDWFYREYLDPRYPLPFQGGALIDAVFTHWASIVAPVASATVRTRLSAIVPPALATATHLLGQLGILALLVPEAFSLRDSCWFAISLLRSPEHGAAARKFVVTSLGLDPAMACELLIVAMREGYENAVWAAELWLGGNAGAPLPPELLPAVLAARASPLDSVAATAVEKEAIDRVGASVWISMIRWHLADEKSAISASAALALLERDERRLGVLGRPLLRGLGEGTRTPGAEEQLGRLISDMGEAGVAWLIDQFLTAPDEHYAVSGRWWALLLSAIQSRSDSEVIVGRCCYRVRGFALARHADVVVGFRVLLAGRRGEQCRSVLRRLLASDDLRERRGAAMVLVAAEPDGNFEAWKTMFSTIENEVAGDDREWPAFLLSLQLDRLTLLNIYATLDELHSPGRQFALLLLEAKGYALPDAERREAYHGLFDATALTHISFSLRRTMLPDPRIVPVLRERLAKRDRSSSEAAGALLTFHESEISNEEAVLCRLLTTHLSVGSLEFLLHGLRLIDQNDEFRAAAAVLIQARPELAKLPLARYAAILQGLYGWSVLIFDALFDGSLEADAHGQALMGLGHRRADLAHEIGHAALTLLEDPAVRSSPFVDSRHWLALLAHEFAGAPSEVLAAVLEGSTPIMGEAARALVARLDRPEVKLNLRERVGAPPRKRRRDSGLEVDVLMRRSESIEPLHCEACIRALSNGTTLDLDSLRGAGDVGALVASILAFCRSGEIKVDQLPRPNAGRLSRDQQQGCREHLLRLWRGLYDEMRYFSEVLRSSYLTEVATRLAGENGECLAWGAELLALDQSLQPAQVHTLLRVLVDAPFAYDWGFCERFASYLTALSTEERAKLVPAFLEAVVRVDGSEMRSHGKIDDTPARLLFIALGYWVVAGQEHRVATKVFLRGFHEALNATRPALAFAIVAPLLESADPTLVRRAAWQASPSDLSVSAFFRFAELVNGPDSLPPPPARRQRVAAPHWLCPPIRCS